MSKLLWYAGIGCLAGAGVGAVLLLAAPPRQGDETEGPGPAPGPGTPGSEGGAACPPIGTRILLLGDSYAQGIASAMTALARGCACPFVASAVVGSHVTEWASDGWLLPALQASTPNVVLVSLGANDFQRNDPGNVQAGVTALVSKIRAAGARVLWIAPLQEPFMDKVGALSMWKDAVGNDWFDSSLLTLPRSGDGIHSTPAGYAAWAAEVWHWASGVLSVGAVGDCTGTQATAWARESHNYVRDVMSRVLPPRGSMVPRAWLKERLSFREAERRLDVKHRAIDSGRVLWHNPRFDGSRGRNGFEDRWQEFKESSDPRDELWYYESEWGFLSGEAGYALVRDGEVVDKIITLVS
jgi:hypothetical protein